MFQLYIYLILILLIILGILSGLSLSFKYAPVKIKFLSICALSCMLIKNSLFLLLFYSQKIDFLYNLRNLAYLNFLYIPVAAIICLFIFIRNDRISFSWIFAISIFQSVIYSIAIRSIKMQIRTLESFGYTVVLMGGDFLRYGFLIIGGILFLICVYELGKETINNLGVFLVLLGILTSISDVILDMVGISYLNHNILGDLFCVLSFIYALNRLKSR